MRKLLLAAVIGISSTLFAIGGIQGQPPQSQPHGMGTMMTTMECPMKVAGADLAIEDTADGIRLTFTTSSGDVAELRRRVEALARMHAGPTAGGMHGTMMRGMEGMKSAPNTTPPEPKVQPEAPDHSGHHPPAEKKP